MRNLAEIIKRWYSCLRIPRGNCELKVSLPEEKPSPNANNIPSKDFRGRRKQKKKKPSRKQGIMKNHL